MSNQLRPPRIVDVGARFGVHPSLRCYENIAEFHLIEPDPDEVARLAELYKAAEHIQVHSLALSDQPGQLMLKLRRHRALSSFYDFNAPLFDDMGYMSREIECVREVTVKVDTLDDMFADRPIDVLKLDTEGAEYDILRGAADQLRQHILILRCEVTFSDVFPGRPRFGDIDRLVCENGFQLLNLDYDGRGVARSPFSTAQRFGQLLSTDATWIRSDAQLFDSISADTPRQILVMAHYLFCNHATDVAVWLLAQGIERCLTGIAPHRETELGIAIRHDMAKLIKNLSYVPGNRHVELMEIYEKAFDDKFPPIYEYYHHFPL